MVAVQKTSIGTSIEDSLDVCVPWNYSCTALETTSAGFGDLISRGGRRPPYGGIFSSVYYARVQLWAGGGRETFGSAGFL